MPLMPLSRCGARGACQQSPILRTGDLRLPGRLLDNKRQGTVLSRHEPEDAPMVVLRSFIMLLAEGENCRGFGGQSPQEARAYQCN